MILKAKVISRYFFYINQLRYKENSERFRHLFRVNYFYLKLLYFEAKKRGLEDKTVYQYFYKNFLNKIKTFLIQVLKINPNTYFSYNVYYNNSCELLFDHERIRLNEIYCGYFYEQLKNRIGTCIRQRKQKEIDICFIE